MKQPKRPNYEQKIRMARSGLDWHEWMVRSDGGDLLTVIHKQTGEVREVWKKAKSN